MRRPELKIHSCYPARKCSINRPITLGIIVKDYIKNYREGAHGELAYFKVVKSLDKAIEYAGLAKKQSGERFSHQKRISQIVLKRATAKLLKAKHRIKSCCNFDELIKLVQSTAGQVRGIGELFYDTALRLGAKLGIYPEKVYLHAGTRTGAQVIRLNTKQEAISLSEVPSELHKLKPHEIEDILCIYKDELVQIRMN